MINGTCIERFATRCKANGRTIIQSQTSWCVATFQGADEQWLRYILSYIIHSKDLRKPRQTKVDTGIAVSSPVKTRRIPLTRRKDANKANVKCVEAHDMLKSVEKALAEALSKKRGVTAFKSAGDVLDFGRQMGWVS